MSADVKSAVIAELEKHGCRVRVEVGRVHDKVHYEHGTSGKSRFTVVPKTASDWRAPLNAVSDLRKDLAVAGIISDAEPRQDRAGVVLAQGRAVCTSLDIAAHFDKRHKDILRAIDHARGECGLEFDQRNFAPISYNDNGRTYRAFEITRDGFTFVAMGFTGPAAARWKVKYIEAFNSLEAQISELRGSLDYPDVRRVEGDLSALTDIVLSLPCDGQPKPRVPWAVQAAAIQQKRAARRARATLTRALT